MLVIRDISVVPSNGWPYYVQSTNTTITSYNYHMLYPMIVKHCQSNGVPVPTQQEVIQNLCDNLSIPCYDDETHSPLINKFALGIPNAPRIGGCCG